MIENKKDIIWRARVMYFVILLFAVFIFYKIFDIQINEGEKWNEIARKKTTKIFNIEPLRGNIFDSEGNLISTSLPIYELWFDTKAEPITNKIFNQKIDSLALCLSKFTGKKTAKQYKKEITKARNRKNRNSYFIARGITQNELQKIKKFPIFRYGRYKGGLVVSQYSKRQLPFAHLALRTIGYHKIVDKQIGLNTKNKKLYTKDTLSIGIEGSYNKQLQGIYGKRIMQKIATGDVWLPINDENEIEPSDGLDLVTTLNISIQDVAHHALEKNLSIQNAHHGTCVLMEVSTGNIVAMVNLTRSDSGVYNEQFNYAIGEATEPGSTFKLPALMVALDDGLAQLTDMVETGNGKHIINGLNINDSHEGGMGRISLLDVFEHSSNVGTTKIIYKHYSRNPQKFIDGLYRMGLQKPLNISLAGEAKPYIKNTNDNSWSKSSLPFMSIGYEERITPLQLLTFYNAVANNGCMVKPKFVSQLKNKDLVIKTFETEILNNKIAQKNTIDKAKKMLEGVVERGTAKALSNTKYKIAAKTGTAQIANNNKGYGDIKSYRASLAGYFPANNPKYSMIVVISEPSRSKYYANDVAGPVFREVADKVYSMSTDIHKELEKDTSKLFAKIPFIKNGSREDISTVLETLKIKSKTVDNSEWVYHKKHNDKIILAQLNHKKSSLPNVMGMGLKDALYLLENAGYVVKVKGYGVVQKQYLISSEIKNKVCIELS
jgi:cell division protein FtsI (penicillin-binding protein 3)